MWRLGIRRPVLWFVVPHVSSLVGRLSESLSIYYCIDDYASLPDVDVEAVRAMDEALMRKADLVFVASDTLLVGKSALNPNTHHSPHGVDIKHFGRACADDERVPRDIAGLPRPIIGFFGLIESWIDLELVAHLAEQRPKWSFLMIGRVAVPEDNVPRLPNLHFLGRRCYEDLPDYGRHFDVAIIPYKLTRQVIHANPLKLREYLAMGKPIVSVRTPETEKFGDVVGIAENREDFLVRLDRVVREPRTPEAVRKSIDRVASSSWEARVAEVLEVMEASLARKLELIV